MKIFDDSERPTTYRLGSGVSLQLFLVCRQVYKEASYIFYSKNRFYVDIMATLVPFLHDRPALARELNQILSIPVPYGKQEHGGGCGAIDRCSYVTRGTFAKSCAYLANHPTLLPNLKQLDLRI